MAFTTFNQFDKRFANFEKFGKDRTVCPLFGLITCHNFMINGNIDQKQHEINIYSAVTNYMTHDIPKYLLFEELLVLTDGTLKHNDIGATTPELIVTGIMGYDNIFKFGHNQNYCVLFLKNRNYIAIMCKYNENNTMYAVRDCHENTQHNFDNFEALKTFLDKTYRFEQDTIVDGVLIPEFSNIEYLVIDTPFNLDAIDVDLVDDTIENEEQEYKEEKIDAPVQTTNYDNDYLFALSLQMEDNEKEYVDYIA
jgi:hypothetical protein